MLLQARVAPAVSAYSIIPAMLVTLHCKPPELNQDSLLDTVE